MVIYSELPILLLDILKIEPPLYEDDAIGCVGDRKNIPVGLYPYVDL